MSEVSRIVLGCKVGNVENIELLIAEMRSRVDGKQNWPCDEAANQRNQRRELQESQQKVGIHRVVFQDISVRDLVHRGDPIGEAGGGFWGALPVLEIADVGTRHIHATFAFAETNEKQCHHGE